MIDCQILCGYFADHNIITVLVASEVLRSPPLQVNKNAHHNFLSLYTEFFFSVDSYYAMGYLSLDHKILLCALL